MKYKNSVIKLVTLVMIGALAVAMVACQAGAPGEAGAPGAPAENPPQTVGTIMAQTVEAGQSLMMDVAKYFSEPESEALTYTATSSDDAIAMATATGSSVTVTGVKAGMADIMVTATDTDKLKVTQTFKVTVTAVDTTPEPEPETPADPRTITISDTKKAPVNLIDHLPDGADPADYVLESRNETVFTTGPKSTSTGPSTMVWEVSAVSKGTDKAEIRSKKDAAVAETLTVIVLNRKPGFHPKAPVISKMTLMKGPHMPSPGGTALRNENADPDPLQLYYTELKVGAQFNDPDHADNGKLTYKITSSRDDVLVRDGSSCTTAMCKVWVDILKKRGNDDFALNVVAEDPDKEMSDSVSFPISMEYPAPQTYMVGQRTTGSFRSITVGDRSSDETEHTLEFKPLPVDTEDPTEEFVFARLLLARLAELKAATGDPDPIGNVGVPSTTTGGPAKMFYINEPLPTDLELRARPTATALAADGTIGVYTVKTTGRVKVAPTKIGTVMPSLTLAVNTSDDTAMNPKLVFTVSDVGEGTIEIGYHVWWDQDQSATTGIMPKWHSAKETLAVTVMAVEP